MSKVAKSFSKRADLVADIILDNRGPIKGPKAEQITRETLSMFKEVIRSVKSNLKAVSSHDFLGSTARSAGRLSGRTKLACRSLLKRSAKRH